MKDYCPTCNLVVDHNGNPDCEACDTKLVPSSQLFSTPVSAQHPDSAAIVLPYINDQYTMLRNHKLIGLTLTQCDDLELPIMDMYRSAWNKNDLHLYTMNYDTRKHNQTWDQIMSCMGDYEAGYAAGRANEKNQDS